MAAGQADSGGDDLVQLSGGEIAQMLGGLDPDAEGMALIAADLQLTQAEVATLVSGHSDLELTPAQYSQLRDSIASRYAQSEAESDQKSSGSLCGTSKPSPKPATKSSAPTSTSSSSGSTSTAKSVPPVTTTASQVSETAAGTTAHTGKVGVGTVTVRTDVQGTIGSTTYKHLFALSYKGKDSKDAHWLQFIHREIIGINADGSAHPQTGSVTTTGGSYDLTPGGTATTNGTPAASNYNTDSASSTDPFYEAAGANNRTADASTMYDLPGAINSRVQAAFSAGAKKVVSRAHFDTFLVQKDKVTYQSSLTIEYTFNSSTATPSPVSTLDSAGAASSLPATIRTRFHSQYSAFNYIN
jgi:hypothetical protein